MFNIFCNSLESIDKLTSRRDEYLLRALRVERKLEQQQGKK